MIAEGKHVHCQMISCILETNELLVQVSVSAPIRKEL